MMEQVGERELDWVPEKKKRENKEKGKKELSLARTMRMGEMPERWLMAWGKR